DRTDHLEPGLRPSPGGSETRSHIAASAPGTEEDAHALNSAQEHIASMPPIALGKDIAEELGATLNSVVRVTSPQGELTPFGLVPKYRSFRVVGIFNSGFFDYDSSWAFARLSDTQQLEALGDQITVLEFKID